VADERRRLVAGNWKMNGAGADARTLVEGILGGLDGVDQATEVAVFPPAPYLALVRELAAGSRLAWGGQTVSEHASGAFTGEVAAAMLADLDCRYVLVGHSERRQLFGESDAEVAAKFVAAQDAGLVPVLCVGETLEERESGTTDAVVRRQIDAVLDTRGIGAFREALVAYEPVWAIGTGKTATPDQAQAVHAMIRTHLASLDGTIADSLRILYGGSVKGGNAAELFAMDDIDGGLIGGASLAHEEFMTICRA